MNVLFDAVEDGVAVLEKGTVVASATASEVGCRVVGGMGDGGGEGSGEGIGGGR